MTTVLTNGTLIDGTGRAPVAGAVVVISGSRIEAAGRADQIDSKYLDHSSAEIFDARGKVIMPGLINCHEHMDERHGYGSYQYRTTQGVTWRALRASRNALMSLQEGVTTVRDLGGRGDVVLMTKKAIAEGMILGPRVVCCGEPISMTGGHGWELNVEADGPDEVRKVARRLLKAGADIVKLMASGGYIEPTKDQPWSLQMSVEEMRAAFDEAKKAGKKTTVHAHPPVAIRAAIDAGVDCIEHGALIDQETARFVAEKGTYLVPTLAEGWEMAHHGLELGRPAWLVERTREHEAARLEHFKLAVQAKVKMAVGTDVIGLMAQEMELMCQGGMNAMDVLAAATRNGAEVCDLLSETGTVEAGKAADVIVVNGDPLKNMSDMRKVELVFAQGRLFRPSELAKATGRYPW